MKARTLCALTITTMLVILGLHYKGVAFFYYDGPKEGSFEATIISETKETEYNNVYTAKINGKKFLIYIPKNIKKDVNEDINKVINKDIKEEINKDRNIKNNEHKNEEQNKLHDKNQSILNYGDKIKIEASFSEAQKARNEGTFDYNTYLKTKKIYGIFKVSKITKIEKADKTPITVKIQNYIKSTFRKNLKQENAELAIALILGDKSKLSEEIEENFKTANLTHILAISGAHFSYIILTITYIGKKLRNKKLEQGLLIGAIILFMNLTGNTPSVTRAGIMGIMLTLSSMLKRQNDFYNSLAISLLIQIILNPYVIFDTGLLLSYSGTIGIVAFYKIIYEKLHLKVVSVTISANIPIIPIMIWKFNTISFSFIISNVLASGLLGIIIMLELITIIAPIKPLLIVLDLSLSVIKSVTNFCAKIPLSKVYVTTNRVFIVLLIYSVIWIITKKRKKIIPILISIVIILNISIGMYKTNIKEELTINFIDVGQGDSSIIRYKGKTIMLDTGGSANSSYDIGKNLLHRYLLNQNIHKINYMMLSHLDADHCQGGIFILKNMKVENLIICKQAEDSNLYQEITSICNEKKINIIYVQKGNKINIQNLKIEILHPEENLISENPLNNNAIVCKMTFHNTKILFTGDIEKIAENKLKKEDIKADILKVGHHGSKTSTTQEFLDKVSPQIALIGVGEGNKFNHPSNEVIERLKNKKIKIYRTDKNGEIKIKINSKGKIKTNVKIR